MSTTTFSIPDALTTSTVRFRLDIPRISGLVLQDGEWSFKPSRRLVTADRIIAPASFEVKPTTADVAAGYFVLDLPATDTGDYGAAWGWMVKEPRPGGITRTVFVPTSTATLEYAALPSIDPATLSPLAQPEAAWTAALDQTNAQVQELVGEVGDANDAVGELAGQTLSRLNLKLDTATYSAFHDLVVTMLTTFTGEIADLTTRVVALEAEVAALQAGGSGSGSLIAIDGGTAAGISSALAVPDGGSSGSTPTYTYDGGPAAAFTPTATLDGGLAA